MFLLLGLLGTRRLMRQRLVILRVRSHRVPEWPGQKVGTSDRTWLIVSPNSPALTRHDGLIVHLDDGRPDP
jgi:hypothetical protein